MQMLTHNFKHSILGVRTANIRKSEIGEIEVNNPMLVVTLPEKLRANPSLRQQLAANREHLITQLDVYATLHHIANVKTMVFAFVRHCKKKKKEWHLQSANWTKDTDFSVADYSPPNITLLGSSLFQPQLGVRNCDTLLVPLQYCLCQHASTLVNDSSLSIQVAELVASKINDELRASKYADKCATLNVDQNATAAAQLKEFDSGDASKRLFNAKFIVSPSGGSYNTYVEKVR